MPLPSKKQTAVKKPAGRKLSDLNLPQGGTSLIVGDAPRTKVAEWFAEPFNKKLPANDPANYSQGFDILNAEHSHYQDKETCLFLVRSLDDNENYYFFMGANETRKAIVDAFAEDSSPIENVCFHRFDTGQAEPFVAIEELDSINGANESDVDF